jgi:hypothetical protein
MRARLIAIGLVATIAACASPPAPTPTPSVEAKIVGRYGLTAAGTTVGTIMSIVRCGDVLYLGDTASRIHRLNISSGRVESPIEDGTLMPMALAADCDRNRVWAISPKPRGHGLRAVGFDLASGTATRELEIPVPCFPMSATLSGDVLFVGGECIEGLVDERTIRPPAASYYMNKRIGVRLSVTSGETRSGLVPFEMSCDGARACVGGTVSSLGDGWIASLPVSAQIGVYSWNGELTRTIPVGSPGATARDGSELNDSASAEQRVKWSTANSLIHGVFAVANHLVVVHYVLDVPTGWQMGNVQPPQFRAKINVLTTDGKPLHVDLPVPELPVGSDEDALYVVDYGPRGRQGAHETVTVLRVAPPVP